MARFAVCVTTSAHCQEHWTSLPQRGNPRFIDLKAVRAPLGIYCYILPLWGTSLAGPQLWGAVFRVTHVARHGAPQGAAPAVRCLCEAPPQVARMACFHQCTCLAE